MRVTPRGSSVAQVSTINDLLDGHVALDLECLDRIYLNAYVPSSLTGQVCRVRGDPVGLCGDEDVPGKAR